MIRNLQLYQLQVLPLDQPQEWLPLVGLQLYVQNRGIGIC